MKFSIFAFSRIFVPSSKSDKSSLTNNSGRTLDIATITLINFNRALESLRTKDDFSFTYFLINRVMRCSTKGASHCCFRKAVSNNYFQKFLLINFISTCSNWLNNFSFTHFLLMKGYGKYSLRKESVIASVIEWLTARESSS